VRKSNTTQSGPQNAAVLRCCEAALRSRRESRSKRLGTVETEFNADQAYKRAMPELIGYENIRDFIACIGHGLVMNNVTAFQADKLLGVARLALATLREQPEGAPGDCRNQPKPENQEAPLLSSIIATVSN
jgi:hypothetical protein